MMKYLVSASILSLGILLSGCSTTDNAAPTPTARSVAESAPRAGLPAQSLEAGECGLFLWTRREQPQFVFFSKAGSENALFWVDNGSQMLSRTGVGGDIFGQQLTEQNFALSDGRSVELRMVPGEQLVGGQRVPEATLTLIDGEGWRTLVPVAGVTVCQAAS